MRRLQSRRLHPRRFCGRGVGGIGPRAEAPTRGCGQGGGGARAAGRAASGGKERRPRQAPAAGAAPPPPKRVRGLRRCSTRARWCWSSAKSATDRPPPQAIGRSAWWTRSRTAPSCGGAGLGPWRLSAAPEGKGGKDVTGGGGGGGGVGGHHRPGPDSAGPGVGTLRPGSSSSSCGDGGKGRPQSPGAPTAGSFAAQLPTTPSKVSYTGVNLLQRPRPSSAERRASNFAGPAPMTEPEAAAFSRTSRLAPSPFLLLPAARVWAHGQWTCGE